MADFIVASDLMLRSFERIDRDKSLGQAMQVLAGLQEQPTLPNALVVVDSGDVYAGILTARLMFTSLLTLWMPGRDVREDENLLTEALLEVVKDRAETSVRDALIRGLPTAVPGDRLMTLIELACDKQLEFVPVVERGKPLGLVPVTQIFQSAAALALTPEHEGIHLDKRS